MNTKKKLLAVRSFFFRLVLLKKVRAYGTLISPFNSFKLRRKKSGNTEVFYHALATYDISLRCSVLWNPKKYDLQMKSRKPIYNKNQRFLEFFSNGIAISKDLLESNFRNKEVLPYFGNMKTPTNEVKYPFIALLLHFDPLVYYASTCP